MLNEFHNKDQNHLHFKEIGTDAKDTAFYWIVIYSEFTFNCRQTDQSISKV